MCFVLIVTPSLWMLWHFIQAWSDWNVTCVGNAKSRKRKLLACAANWLSLRPTPDLSVSSWCVSLGFLRGQERQTSSWHPVPPHLPLVHLPPPARSASGCRNSSMSYKKNSTINPMLCLDVHHCRFIKARLRYRLSHRLSKGHRWKLKWWQVYWILVKLLSKRTSCAWSARQWSCMQFHRHCPMIRGV